MEKTNLLLPLALNLGRYLLFAGIPFLLFYVLFPQMFSANKIQKRLAKHKDFVRELLHSLQTIAILIAVAWLVLHSPLRIYSQIYDDLHAYPLWWIPTSVLLAMILHDSYFYWMHRSIHHQNLFKRVHLVHHQSTNPSPLASYSFNFLEGILEALIGPIILFLIPMHPLAILLFTLTSFIFNVYGHLGYEIAPRWFRHSFLFDILNTSVHHNLHHKAFRGNYGLYFRYWDRWMGTEHPDYEQEYDAIQQRRFGKISSAPFPKTVVITGMLFMTTGSSLFAQSSIEGNWVDEIGGGIISIYEQDGSYHGQVVGAIDAEEQQKIQGKSIQVLSDFKKIKANTYCCGDIFQVREKRHLSGKLILLDKNRLKVTGQYGPYSRSRIWKRQVE